MNKGSRRRRLAVDLAICAAMLAFAVPVTLQSAAPDGAGAGTPFDTILLPTVILPILLRRRDPFAAAVALAIGCIVSGIPTFDQFRLAVAIPAAMLILLPLARDTDRRRAVTGLVVVLAGMVFIGATEAVLSGAEGVADMVAFSFPLCIGVWVGGRVIRSRDVLAEQLAERSLLLERQRDETAQLAVEVERAQLATDLDAAARDRVRVMIELAESGERSLATDPEHTPDTFARIETMGRESLNEMRGLLGVLRSDERGVRFPRPTLAQIETLLADARRGGRPVHLEVQGERRPLPGALELAAYRVLQHALLALDGGDDAAAQVCLRYLPAALEVEVQGTPAQGRGADVALMAARERVVAHGGDFSAAQSTPLQTVLRARLPIGVAHA